MKNYPKKLFIKSYCKKYSYDAPDSNEILHGMIRFLEIFKNSL